VAETHDLTIEIVDGIAEWDRTSNAYVPLEELRATDDPRWRALVEGRWDSPEETMDEFHDRVITAIDGISHDHRSSRVVVVCHGGVINAYLGAVLGLAPSMGFFYPNYTSVHRVAVGSHGVRSIIAVNETAHLRGSDLLLGLFDEVSR
jgi:2,3-bisphosphoglycerate-dependent phosphoglycerate mutase